MGTWARVKRIYNVYVTTSEYDGATGQCTQGKLRRHLDTSDGIKFPSGNDVKVSEQRARDACAHLSEQKENCVTDLRMVNEPDAVAKMTKDFETVETTVKRLEATTTTTSTTTSTTTETSTPAKVTETSTPAKVTETSTPAKETETSTTTQVEVKVSAATTTHLCFSVLVMLIGSML